MKKQKQAYSLQVRVINGKQFLVPIFNLYNCQKYMLPKLDNAPVHHTYYQQKDLEQMYKQYKINPQQLNHNLNKIQHFDKVDNKNVQPVKEDVSQENLSSIQPKDSSSSLMSSETLLNINKKLRPPLRETGYTHFIHIPLWDALKDFYNNEIVPKIQQQDGDLLIPLSSMHMTVLVFRLKKIEDLSIWSKVIKSTKKMKISIKGVNIFPIKKNFARVLFLNIKGVQDLIDRVVSRAIQQNLITESQLSHIKFDKISGTYKAEPHITLLRTKGDDLFDFTDYLKIFSKISLNKININEIRISIIGSHDGNDYFNEEILPL